MFFLLFSAIVPNFIHTTQPKNIKHSYQHHRLLTMITLVAGIEGEVGPRQGISAVERRD